jgi:1-deoxy-D-xylulose-5-phosphate synthase
LIDRALRDLRVCAVTAAMPTGTGLSAFAKACPDRFYDVGIAEEHAVSMAAGLALAGMRPYVAVYSTFLQRAFDQILTEVCLQNLPVTLLVDRAGLVGSDGATHQGAFDLMYLGNLPGMTLAAPRDQRDLRRLLQLSLSMEGPMAIRYPKDAFDMGPGMQEGGELKPGEWELLMDGHDAMILAVGRMVELALAVSIELNGKQLSCGVMDARFIKPMDEEKLFQVANRVALVVTLEEGSVLGGFGCAVMEKLAKAGVQVPLLPLGIPDCVIEQGSIDQQMEDAGLTCRQVSERIRERMAELFHGDQQD